MGARFRPGVTPTSVRRPLVRDGFGQKRLAKKFWEDSMSLISRRAILGYAAAMPVAGAFAAPVAGSYGMVRRRSAELDAIIAIDAVVEQVGWGYQWSEGPVWDKKGGALLFSDPKANTMYRWAPGGTVTTFLQPSGYAGAPNPALR
jgi:gluconolactonase